MNVLICTNILTPYRVHFFDEIEKNLNTNDRFLVVVMAESEPRINWNYGTYKKQYTKLLNGKRINLFGISCMVNKGVKRTVCEFHPDVCILAGSYFNPTNLEICRIGKKYKIPTLFWSESHLNEVHNIRGLKKQLREAVRRYSYKRFDGFLYAGKMSLEFIEKYERECAIHYFLPNLVNRAVFDKELNDNASIQTLRKKYRVGVSQFVFFCPARLIPEKGILEFIELFSGCPSSKNATVLIAGEGELRKEIESLIIKTGMDIRLLGLCSEQEIRELYSLCDCFLLPSKSDANPLSCVEAIWSGKPLLVSTHVGNYPEIVKEGVNGFVFSYNQEDAKSYIERIIHASDEWLKSAADYSYQLAVKHYDTEKVVKDFIAFLRSMHSITR